MSEELMDWKIAEETATDLIKARYDAIAELNIV